MLEDPLSIECLKGVKTLCTFNVLNCVRKDSFVFVVQKGFMTIKEDFAQLFIIIRGCNVIDFKKFEDLWDEDASRTVKSWTAQQKVFNRFIFKTTFAQRGGAIKGFAEAMLPKITVTYSEACQMFNSFQVGSIWYKFLFWFGDFCETVFEAVCI